MASTILGLVDIECFAREVNVCTVSQDGPQCFKALLEVECTQVNNPKWVKIYSDEIVLPLDPNEIVTELSKIENGAWLLKSILEVPGRPVIQTLCRLFPNECIQLGQVAELAARDGLEAKDFITRVADLAGKHLVTEEKLFGISCSYTPSWHQPYSVTKTLEGGSSETCITGTREEALKITREWVEELNAKSGAQDARPSAS